MNRVLVTRPLPEAERTAARLADLGFEPVVAPVLTIRTLDAEPLGGDFAAILVTSAQAVPTLARVRARLDDAPVYAVGERAADALREAGFSRVEACAGSALDLARTVVAKVPSGARLLHVAGRDHKPEPALSLGNAGLTVVPWIVYAAEAEPVLPTAVAAFLQAGAEDGLALHYSRRSLDILLALADTAGLAPALIGLGHVCLSHDVAAPLAARGARRIAVAAQPDEDALLEALLAFVGTGASAGSPAPQSRC